jgi:phosphoribosylanthranilate isomerase/indole-3-glycerol phosphate synthase/phosphoribosylanthranilate isomerase
MVKILREIYDRRMISLKEKGLTFGRNIPSARKVPLVRPSFDEGLLIAEIKRKSPSAGSIGEISDPCALAEIYLSSGAGMISVLTEEDYFGGSLDDLMAVKNRFPDAAILRKDFIQHEDEVDIAYRAGADAVLVITAMKRIYDRAVSHRLLPLVEIHDEEEMNLALKLNPEMIGINSRNLDTFVIDKNYPLALMEKLRGRKVIFESGIESFYDAYVAASSGFAGCLVGTSLVKSGNSSKVKEVKAGIKTGINKPNRFFSAHFKKAMLEEKLSVKICGLTNAEDALLAEKLGADICGFVAAESKRKLSADEIEKIAPQIKTFKSVIITEPDEKIFDLARNGIIDAVQLHGDSFDEKYFENTDYFWCRALNISSADEAKVKSKSRFTILDSKSETKGGSGIRIDSEVIAEINTFLASSGRKRNLYLAGGINAENAAGIEKRFTPALIDISSGVEEFPGKKSREKLVSLFESIKRSI